MCENFYLSIIMKTMAVIMITIMIVNSNDNEYNDNSYDNKSSYSNDNDNICIDGETDSSHTSNTKDKNVKK